MLTSGSAIGTLFTGILGSFILDYFGWAAVFRIIGNGYEILMMKLLKM